MAHVAKHTRGASGHMCAHYDRTAKNISNENINPERTKDNYNLGPERDASQMDFINQRCGEVKCLNRKDVNVMCSWVVTAPKDLPQEDMKQFFETSYDFLKDRYGERNIVSAHVHMDEGQPHLHFAFVPVVMDQHKGIEKVSAKECVNRTDLQTFHKDLDNRMTEVFGRDVGVLNEATKEGNKSIEELKRKSATERLQEAEHATREAVEASRTLQDTQQRINDAEGELKRLESVLEGERVKIERERAALKDSMNKLQADKMNHEKNVDSHLKQKNELKTANAALKTKVEAYNNAIGSRAEIREIDKRKKNIPVAGQVILISNDYDMLKASAMLGAYHKDTKEEHERVLMENRDLKKRVEASKTSIVDRLQGDNRLEREHSTLKRQYAAAERVIKKNGLEKELKMEIAKPIDVER